MSCVNLRLYILLLKSVNKFNRVLARLFTFSLYFSLSCFTSTLFAAGTETIFPTISAEKQFSAIVESPFADQSLWQLQQVVQDTNRIFTHARNYAEEHPAEKVYLHFDRSFYLVGENCWFKAYVVNAADLQPSDLSGILYIDWIDPAGKIIKHQKLKIYDGEANGDLSFTAGTAPGNYSVRAYTKLMRNEPDFFFTKSFNVYGQSLPGPGSIKKEAIPSIDLQFFPESGIAVNDIQTTIAFKAIDREGRGVDVEGKIVDGNNEPVGSIKSIHKGLGLFPYTPTNNKSYRVILNTGESFDFPTAATSGCILNVNNTHPEKIFVTIKTSKDFLSSECYLTGQSRGIICFSKTFKIQKDQANLEISKKDLPGGVLQLTLFDHAQVPRSERMIFIDNQEKFRISIESDKQEFRPRDSVSIKVQATDMQGHPLETSLSISITDAGIVTGDSASNNIASHFLLQSDMKGSIDDPGWYFEPKNIYALDLVMLTNGWRKFDWDLVLNNNIPAVKYNAEQALTLEGSVMNKSGNKPIADARLTLMMSSVDYNGFYTTESDQSGRFRLENVDFSDSTILIWQIHNAKSKPLDADIILVANTDTPAVNRRSITAFMNDRIVEHRLKEYIEPADTADGKYQLLEEVRVANRRRSSVEIGYNKKMIRPSKDDLKLNASTFIASHAPAIPFLQEIILPDGTSHWVMKSGAGISFFIDGYPISSSSNPYLVMNSYRADEIEYVVVNGDYRHGYIIAMKTKKDLVTGMNKGIIKQLAPGYQWTRTFYQPKYGANDISSAARDNRMTLYWNPYVITGTDGKAIISFYNSDAAKNFNVVVEGIANGRIGTQIKKF